MIRRFSDNLYIYQSKNGVTADKYIAMYNRPYEVGINVSLDSIVAQNQTLSQIPKLWIEANVEKAPFRVKVIKLA